MGASTVLNPETILMAQRFGSGHPRKKMGPCFEAILLALTSCS